MVAQILVACALILRKIVRGVAQANVRNVIRGIPKFHFLAVKNFDLLFTNI